MLAVLAWRCRARLPNVLGLPAVFDDCSSASRRLTLREMAIIREFNETVFALNFLEMGGIVGSESCKKVRYSILSTGQRPPALRHLHLVISDFRPPCVTESGEAAPRRLLGSRANGCYSLTSHVPAPGSLTVFQSSRVARPLDASKAPHLMSLLCFSDRSYLDALKQCMLRHVSELGLAGRYVDPVFQHSRRHYVGFVRDLVKVGSVAFVEDAVEHVGLFFVAKKAGAQTFIMDARSSNRHLLRPPSGPLLTGEGLGHVEFQGPPEDA